MQLELTGLKELLAKLENARVEMNGPEMKKALRAGGRVIVNAMIADAPILDKKTADSTSLEPGALKAGLRVSVTTNDNDQLQALIGPNAKVEHAARWVEYGHRQVHGGYSKVNANGTTRGPGVASEVDVPAYPFIRPAFESSVNDAGEAYSASLKESFKKVLS